MPSKPIELPPEVAKAFVRDMRAFFAAGGMGVESAGIAARQLHAPKEHYSGKLRLTEREGALFTDARPRLNHEMAYGPPGTPVRAKIVSLVFAAT